MENKLKKHLESKIIRWNNTFPLDYWWRTKHGIPYGSKAHKEMSFIDMYFEYLEEKMFKEKFEDEPKNENSVSKISQNEIDEDFDNLDLSKY